MCNTECGIETIYMAPNPILAEPNVMGVGALVKHTTRARRVISFVLCLISSGTTFVANAGRVVSNNELTVPHP